MAETYSVPKETLHQAAGALAVAIAILDGIETTFTRKDAKQNLLDAAWALDNIVQEQDGGNQRHA